MRGRERRRAMKPEVLEQVKELLKEASTEEEITELSSIIEEAKGKIRPTEGDRGFWAGRTACWEMFGCPPDVRSECPAFAYRATPCWEIEGTYCKLSDGQKGAATQVCESCRVYKKYGHAEPIRIRLFGKGFDPVAKIFGRQAERLHIETEIRTETLRVGDSVRVKECGTRPELVGAQGEIVQMQTQEPEKYCVRPLWVKIPLGQGLSKTYGFWEHEVEPVQ